MTTARAAQYPNMVKSESRLFRPLLNQPDVTQPVADFRHVVNPLVLLHRDRVFSAGSNGHFNGKTERISDCRVYSFCFFSKNVPESHNH